MATVHRIENAKGYGAYGVGPDWGEESPYDLSGRHPGPGDDSALSPAWYTLSEIERNTYRFGFRDHAQMRAWFYRDEWLIALKAVGCRLTVWNVPDEYVHYGNCQAIFKREKATLISSEELV